MNADRPTEKMKSVPGTEKKSWCRAPVLKEKLVPGTGFGVWFDEP